MLFRVIIVFMITLLLGGCALLTPLPKKTQIGGRLAMFPVENLPLKQPVTVYWDDHQVPFIEAQTDEDLAFTLGLVHAHLRLAQMEIARHIALGRIAEMGGPLAVDIDHSLRVLNFSRAADATLASMPAESRAWLDAYVRGVNHYQRTAKTLPAEFAILGLKREPWTARDVIALGRLGSSDVNWLVWFRLLKLRERKDWPSLWARLLRNGGDSMASFRPVGKQAALEDILRDVGRNGSNSLVVAGAKTRTGAAMIASDPHLGIMLPNIWLVAGMKSPSYHAVGLMAPGLPFLALGRNAHIAWGGTNMRAASSDLYDVSKLPQGSIRERTETIRVRWWADRDITVRDTELGPVITDAPLVESAGDKAVALRWVGHQPSDEITAFLKVTRAASWPEFRAAFGSFAVSAQNMLYADTKGNIGQVMAVRLPVRKTPEPRDLVLDPTRDVDQWHGYLTARDLPASYNPSEGFLASANNRPAPTRVPVGYFFSTDDRVERMSAIMKADGKVSFDDLKTLQRDVYLISAVALRDVLVAAIDEHNLATVPSAKVVAFVKALRAWDGYYRAEERGPVAFEVLFDAFSRRFRSRLYDRETAAVIAGQSRTKMLLAEDIRRASPEAVRADLSAALVEAADRFAEYKNWGEMHRLVLGHPLRLLPIVGGRYTFFDLATDGSNDTVWKTAHPTTHGRHATSYGSTARHISDLSNPDANYFVLLGGQDGWFNSSTFADQVPLWLKGEYVQVPLTMDKVRATFAHKMELKPGK